MNVSKSSQPAGREVRYDAILFDFDGVLADTEPLHCECWAEVLRPLGIRLDWDMYRSIGIGASDRELAEFLSRQPGPPVTPDQLLSYHPQKRILFSDRVLADPPIPIPIRKLINSLSTIKLAVVTSSFRSEIEPILEKAGLRHLFEVFVSGDEVENLKPAPDPYLLAAKRLRAKSPLVIEDSDAGVASGQAAGFDVMRVQSPAEVPAAVRNALQNGRASA